MENFFEGIKIRKLIFVYISIVIFFCIISEIDAVESSKIWSIDLFLLLCNLGVLVWFLWRLKKSKMIVKYDIVNLKKDLKDKDVVWSILINIILTVGILVTVAYTVLYFFPSHMNTVLKELNETDTNSFYDIIIFAVTASFVVPIVEEFIFRGVILNRLKIKWDIKKSVIASSFLFGIIHSDVGIIPAFVFGACMALIYLKTKNIFVTIIIHGINNFIVSIVLILSFLMEDGPANPITESSFKVYWFILGILGLMVGSVMSVHFIKIKWREIRCNCISRS